MNETTLLSLERHRMKRSVDCVAAWVLGALVVTSGSPSSATEQTITVNPSTMPRFGSVEARYQSYNIEMLEEVTCATVFSQPPFVHGWTAA